MASFEIRVVGPTVLRDVILTRLPLGLFLTREMRRWVAVDNSDGNAWTEEFHSKRKAVRWLRREFEISQ